LSRYSIETSNGFRPAKESLGAILPMPNIIQERIGPKNLR
jgi:hypothetical protein